MTALPGHDSALLSAAGISVSLGGMRILRDVHCRVEPSEVVGIIGPNGAGKTTLFNSVSRLLPLGPGASIHFAGHDLLRRGPRQLASLGMARTFQNIELSMRSSVRDNVTLGAHHRQRFFRGPGAQRTLDQEISEYLTLLQIERWAESRIEDIPYAARKRAEICRALLSEPTLLLLDEPASGMSAAEKAQLRAALRDVNARTGAAILIIEHDVGFMTNLCDRLMALSFGEVICEGSPSEVTEDERVIAAYLGAS